MILKIFVMVFCSSFGISFTQSSCRTPNGEISYCVPIYECKIFLDVLKSNRLTPQITRFFRESQCESGNTPRVCCGSFIDYEDGIDQNANESREVSTLAKPECGKFFGDKYASKSNLLKINEYPWAALIEYKNNEGSTGHHCGAVLINKDFVLTAAHCVIGNVITQFGNAYQVRLGEYDRSTEKDCVNLCNGTYTCFDNHRNIRINNILIHPLYTYNNGSYKYDIALIKLEEPVIYSDFIRPVCLTSNNITLAGDEYSVVGWGINENSKGQVLKHHVKAFVLTNEQCSELNPINTTISSSQFCAVKSGVQEKNMYCGDTGGAIVSEVQQENSEDYFVLQGIESFNFNKINDVTNFIIVYTKTSEYIDWILEELLL